MGLEVLEPDLHAEAEKKLLEPFTYLTEKPGKGVRSMLMNALNIWLEVPADKLEYISSVIDMLHNASLLIDDIQDNSKLRRGKPTAHLVFGEAIVINCANYVYFLAQEKLLKLNRPELMIDFTTELLNLHRGQGMEIIHRNTGNCPTENQYLQMVSNKTGGLLRMAVKLILSFATKQPKGDIIRLVDLIGAHFQIRDDFLNLESKEFMETKGFCEDITEGKFSFPMVHAIHSRPSDNTLIDILALRTDEHEIQKKAVEWIRSAGSFEYTKKYLKTMESQIREEIALIGPNPHLTAIVDKLSLAYASPS